jgi:hypothetical protein
MARSYKPRLGSIDPNAGGKGSGSHASTGSAEDMSDSDLAALVKSLVEESEVARDDDTDGGTLKTRERAQEYFDGKMPDTPSDIGRSKVISKDLRAVIKKVMPSLVRTILGNDQVVEYIPTKEGDEAYHEQATIYVNDVILPETSGYDAIYDAMHDAALQRNGILKWWFEEKVKVGEKRFTGLDEAAFQQLILPEEVEVREHSQYKVQVETVDPMTGQPTMVPEQVHDVLVKIMKKHRQVKLACYPREQFLIHPDALSIETSQLVGTVEKVTRSDLIAMGYDYDQVMELPLSDDKDEQEQAEATRRRNLEDGKTYSPATEEIDYYDLYVRVDYDDDGIAELRRIVMAGALTEENILENEMWDDAPLEDIKIERRPHQWEGQSITDDVADLQQIKTVLWRSTLDNIYSQNNQTPVYVEGSIKNPDAFYNRRFGEPIIAKAGSNANDVVSYLQVPNVTKDAFAMLPYIDSVLEDRTGISDASSGLAPDALQNVTAKATALIEQQGIGQTEQMVRTVARGGLEKMFKGILKLIVQHQDKPRTVWLTDKWVTFDPRNWNGEMGCKVNTGLGAGTRERDMAAIGFVLQLQEKFLMAMGADDNPFVSPENLWNGVQKAVQATGLPSVTSYFTKPDEQKLEQRKQQKAQQEDPQEKAARLAAESAIAVEKVKGEANMAVQGQKSQADAQKMQMEMQKEATLEQARIQREAAVEREQMQADLQVKLAELQKEQAIEQQRMDWEREKLQMEFAHEIALKQLDMRLQERQNEIDDRRRVEDYSKELFMKEKDAEQQEDRGAFQ